MVEADRTQQIAKATCQMCRKFIFTEFYRTALCNISVHVYYHYHYHYTIVCHPKSLYKGLSGSWALLNYKNFIT